MVGQLTALVFVDAVEQITSPLSAGASTGDETGELLARMLRAIQLGPEDYRVYPTVFCGSTLTVAAPKDLKTCLTHGEKLAAHLRPRVILALGGLAAQTWAGHPFPWEGLRGKLFYPPGLNKLGLKIPVLATYHPRDMIRFPGYKKNVWEDLKRLRSYLDGQAKHH
jgi:DNA polymerase